MDDEHWITINGNHVLINEKGEVQSGLGGKFNGRRISKYNAKYPKTKEEIEAATEKAFKKRHEAEKEREAIENSRDYKRADRGRKNIDKEMESRYYRSWKNPEKHASLEALRQQYIDQQQAMTKAAKEKFNKADKRVDNLLDVKKNNKNGIFTNQTAKRNRLTKSIANAERAIKNREQKVNEKADAIEAKYNKMAERVGNSSIGEKWDRNHLAGAVQRRGKEKAQNYRENAREGMSFHERKRDALYANRADLRDTEKKINALKKFKDKTNSKLKSAAEANAYMKERGTKVSKATPEMASGYFKRPLVRAKGFKTLAGKERDHTIKRLYKKAAEQLERKERAARQTLAKARPKIAERREAIRKYNEREDEKLAKAMGLGKYRKPYYETDAFKSGKKNDYI